MPLVRRTSDAIVLTTDGETGMDPGRYNPSMSNPVTLPLNCPQCSRPVTLRFSAWTTDVPRKNQTWKCPHCHAENKADLPGKLEWVLARQDNDPPPANVKRTGPGAKHKA